MKRRGFTLVELLVVISIIALLIALLLPALAKAKSLALRIECASNMQQVGIAMSEYANTYKGHYPLAYTNFWPFGSLGGWNSSAGTFSAYPTWGLGLLYYDSFGAVGNTMVNPRPGFLSPTPTGLSLIYSTQPGTFSQQRFIPSSDYNSSGIMDNWSDVYSGYCYWVDYGAVHHQDYEASQDLAAIEAGTGYNPTYTFRYYHEFATNHVPAASPLSNPGSILVTDEVFLNGPQGTAGEMNQLSVGAGSGYPGAASNHVTGSSSNYLPSGAHELYNNGAVVWEPMSQIKCRMEVQWATFMGW